MYLLLMALALGIKHAYDADHLLAVSNFLTRGAGFRSATMMTLNWALGHTATAAAVTLLLFLAFSGPVVSFLGYFESGVGVMLIVMGTLSIAWETGRFRVHLHRHRHGRVSHSHRHVHAFGFKRHLHPHLFAAGVIQGLASDDELLTLLAVSLGIVTLPGMFLNIGIYSMGVAIGMVLFGWLVSYPMARIGAARVKRVVIVSVGVISILYGLLLLL